MDLFPPALTILFILWSCCVIWILHAVLCPLISFPLQCQLDSNYWFLDSNPHWYPTSMLAAPLLQFHWISSIQLQFHWSTMSSDIHCQFHLLHFSAFIPHFSAFNFASLDFGFFM